MPHRACRESIKFKIVAHMDSGNRDRIGLKFSQVGKTYPFGILREQAAMLRWQDKMISFPFGNRWRPSCRTSKVNL